MNLQDAIDQATSQYDDDRIMNRIIHPLTVAVAYDLCKRTTAGISMHSDRVAHSIMECVPIRNPLDEVLK